MTSVLHVASHRICDIHHVRCVVSIRKHGCHVCVCSQNMPFSVQNIILIQHMKLVIFKWLLLIEFFSAIFLLVWPPAIY